VIPADATVYEAAGKVLFPGMILAHTQIGLDVSNENMPVAPFVNVYDAIEPNALEWEECLRAGISTIHVIQGNSTVIAVHTACPNGVSRPRSSSVLTRSTRDKPCTVKDATRA
jgi:imidazolonepropionase-like amidohydrolase